MRRLPHQYFTKPQYTTLTIMTLLTNQTGENIIKQHAFATGYAKLHAQWADFIVLLTGPKKHLFYDKLSRQKKLQ